MCKRFKRPGEDAKKIEEMLERTKSSHNQAPLMVASMGKMAKLLRQKDLREKAQQ